MQFGDIGQKNVLLRAGDPGDWAALFDRIGYELAPALHTVLSDACIEAAIAARRPAYLNMVVNRGHIRDRPDLVERLASGDHPASQMAYSSVLTEPRLRRRLLAAARPATLAWTEPDGLVSWLLGRSDLTEGGSPRPGSKDRFKHSSVDPFATLPLGLGSWGDSIGSAARARWNIEEAFRSGKGLTSLDEHQVRRYTS